MIKFIFLLIIVLFAVINDFRTKKIKNFIPIMGVLIGIIINLFTRDVNFLYSFAISLIYFIFLYYFPKKIKIKSLLGAGDIKLYMVASFILGWKFSLDVFVFSVIIGSLFLILLNIKRIKKIKFNVAMFLSSKGKYRFEEKEDLTNIFTPYIFIGSILAYLFSVTEIIPLF